MKKLFITLSFFFVAAYANNSMSGYTESIVENANLSSNESTILEENHSLSTQTSTQKPQRLAIQPAGYLDGTYETPHNPYSGKIKEYSWQNELPKFTETDGHPYGFDQTPEHCLKTNRTVEYCVKNMQKICESDDPDDQMECYYLKKECLCYERLPTICNTESPADECKDLFKDAKIPTIYISAEKGKEVSFDYDLSTNINDKYCLVRYDYVKDGEGNYIKEKNKNSSDGFGGELKTELVYAKPFKANRGVHTIEGIYTQTEGLFKLMKAVNKKCKPTKNTVYSTAIKVIPYEMDTKKFVYIQMDGGVKDIEKNSDYPNAFTKAKVDKFVNEVFKQAVLNTNSTDGTKKLNDAKETFQNELIQVEMTNPSATEDDFYKKLDKIYKFFNISSSLDKKNEAWHIIVAINKVRKKWHLDKCRSKVGAPIELRACASKYKFQPEQEGSNTQYYIKSAKGCRKGINPEDERPVIISATPKISDGSIDYDYYGQIKKDYHVIENGEKQELKDCDTLFTDNGYAVIPTADGIDAAGISIDLGRNTKFGNIASYEHDIFDDYLAYGSIMIVPRNIGDESFYTSVHELLHSFGLTDIASVSDFEVPIKDPTSRIEIEYDPSSYKTNWGRYKNEYGTQESNVMEYKGPGGNRIRHRENIITCTGGQTYYASLIKETAMGPLVWDPIEIGLGPLVIDGIGENQWDCLRDCLNKPDFSTKSRKIYWNNSDKCALEDKEITLPQQKYIDAYQDNPKYLAKIFPIRRFMASLTETEKKSPENYRYYSLEEVSKNTTFSIEQLRPYFEFVDFAQCYDYVKSEYCFKLDDLRNCTYLDGKNRKPCFESSKIEDYLKNNPRN
ncbi:hypothetical protein [Fibrobacter sp. UWB11]|uniref:hypothetical protein n=1 Tax=Fibrobacter sp. UWB11 TaxID=1896202 RepID=UPI00092CE242|nr:hypothetical protein [Fibrobacter sp. UWB11]SIO06275.1 hypothetical protein SAMN05720758_1235 [Fibrobacter sp. UWB11]